MAHTWSRFVNEGPDGAWDVQRVVPVKGIFCLARSAKDRVERIGSGQAVSLLGEAVQQVSRSVSRGLGKEELRPLHLERFNNLCALARAVPTHMLHISLTGAFWKEIDKALEGSH